MKHLLPVLLSIAFVFPALAADTPEVDLDALVERARANAKRSEEAIVHYTFLQHETSVVRKKNGDVVEENERLYRVVPLEIGIVRELLEVDGRAPTKKELKKNEKQNDREVDRETKKREKLAEAGEEEADESGSARLIELLSRTDYEVVGREMVDGRELIGLAFEPSVVEGEKGVTKKLLKHLRGTVWLDMETGEAVRAEAGNADRFRLKGVVGVKDFSFRLEQVRVHDELWLPSIVEVDGLVSVMGLKRRFESVITFSEHRKATVSVEEEEHDEIIEALEELTAAEEAAGTD
ncbi:MAG: hypothetical protein AAF533_03010 [Acidobacteriota bacterium]